MLSNRKSLILFDVERTQDFDTGDTTISAVNVKNVVCEVDEAGIQTQQLGQMQNAKISKSIIIDKMFFDEQAYCYISKKLYAVSNTSPARLKKDVKLNVARLTDTDTEKAIKEWINGNL